MAFLRQCLQEQRIRWGDHDLLVPMTSPHDIFGPFLAPSQSRLPKRHGSTGAMPRVQPASLAMPTARSMSDCVVGSRDRTPFCEPGGTEVALALDGSREEQP